MPPKASLTDAYQRLREAAARLESVRRLGWEEVASRLDVKESPDGLRVHWLLNEDAQFERGSEEPVFSDIFRLLGSPQITPWLSTLTLEGHQIAANGTIDWEIEPVAHAKVPYSRLKVGGEGWRHHLTHVEIGPSDSARNPLRSDRRSERTTLPCQQ
jgi:hypothetical protein